MIFLGKPVRINPLPDYSRPDYPRPDSPRPDYLNTPVNFLIYIVYDMCIMFKIVNRFPVVPSSLL